MSSYQQYRRFMAWLSQEHVLVEPDVCRLVNIVDANFEDIAQTTSAARSRSVLVARLLTQKFTDASANLPDIQVQEEKNAITWTRIAHLTVGPFRGFRYSEPFDLDHKVVLFYGPNGSGKTSLCEAIEQALLGSVDESKVNRLGEDYLKNLHEQAVVQPVLLVKDKGKKTYQVTPDADLYRFCFIEKNRIDAFSRIAARTPGQRKDLIAALFGIEDFSDFVGDFNDTDVLERLLQPPITKRDLLARAQETNESDQKTLMGEAADLTLRDIEEAQVASDYQQGMTYNDALVLLGTPELPGRLHELTDELLAVPAIVVGMTVKGMQDGMQTLKQAYAVSKSLDRIRQERATDISYKSLYEAVRNLKFLGLDHCPACDTPLEVVTENPFKKADAVFDSLIELVELEEKIVESKADWKLKSEALFSMLSTIAVQSYDHRSELEKVIADIDVTAISAWWKPLLAEIRFGSEPSWDIFLAEAKRVEALDAQICNRAEQRDADRRELVRLNQLKQRATELSFMRRQVQENAAGARERIAAFECTNAALIAEAADEAVEAENAQRYLKAYETFRSVLRKYCSALPGELVANLNIIVSELYNNFNQDDLKEDILQEIRLPTTEGDRIEISFKTEPKQFVDALHVLSEGHIRCLGLAILLGKNIQQGAPLVLFDDAVNAIDHDHRRGIRETLFRHPSLENKQIVLTCHSDDFITAIQNLLPKNEQAQLYVFRPHEGARHPNILRKTGSRHYLEQANIAYAEGRIASCLQYCRQALELLNLKIWSWLCYHNQGVLTLQLYSANSTPGSRNVTDALRIKLEVITFAPSEKEVLLTGLRRLLNISELNLVWKYLNKGTHVEGDRDDFELPTVALALEVIGELSELKLKRG